MSKILPLKEGFLGFHRLAIMGLSEKGMQPFEFEGNYVVCNGEIYGFRKIKEELDNKFIENNNQDTANDNHQIVRSCFLYIRKKA